MRGKAWRLQQLRNKINKRMKIVKQWRFNNEKDPLEDQPHRVHKFNLNCGCKMCHYYKHIGNKKGRLTYKEQSDLEEFLKIKNTV